MNKSIIQKYFLDPYFIWITIGFIINRLKKYSILKKNNEVNDPKVLEKRKITTEIKLLLFRILSDYDSLIQRHKYDDKYNVGNKRKTYMTF